MEEPQKTREAAIAAASEAFDSGAFFADLQRRVAFRTSSQDGVNPELSSYITDEISATLARLSFTARVVENPVAGGP
ncbi:M20 peptidase family dipeptidase, partial [Burkholderia pseudomallei]